MRFFIGLRNALLISLVLLAGIIGITSAEDYIEDTALAQNAIVKIALIFDNMEIHNSHAEIRTIKLYLDADGNEVRREAGRNFIYRNVTDNPDTPEDETSNALTLFMQKLGVTKANIKQAVREMELGE